MLHRGATMRPVICSVGLPLVTAFVFAASLKPVTQADHIHAVETNLSSGEAISGHPQPPRNITECLTYYHVPGASIAVIYHGKMEWARGYGVQEIGGALVTADTLFSAASISKT